ncbi:SDR family oxidoreductase [Ancylomarina longa]|uniref:SDR family oxidoreductase n=1 Tax=Ancylomarina longa TaxID=2487017 RepID=A0A434AXM9_9BACT|nr:SDR family oxidoreductase [Ancylomarina longa]RUT79313.1 SDR family oxidoreductase [Ancylomarina longa]
MSKILITGATGNLGKSVIHNLLKVIKPGDLAVLGRNAEKLENLKIVGVDVRIGDYNDYDSLLQAFQGIDKLYFVSGNDMLNRSKQHENVVNAAKVAGIKHIVYTSFLCENETKTSPISFITEDHIITENWLKVSGMKYTILKHNLYMDMLPIFIGEKVLETGTIYLPAGEGKAAFTLREDLAEVAAHILTTEGHENKEYDLTADKAYSYDEIATIISNISGKIIRYYSPSNEEFTKTLTEAGVPEEYIELFAGFSLAIGNGELDKTNSLIEQLIGRKSTSVEEYLEEIYS